MDISSNAEQFRKRIRDAIRRKFADLVKDSKLGNGSIADVAAQLGIKRQMLPQYGDGSVPGADVLLMAFLKWDWVIKVECKGETPEWYEFSMSDREGDLRKRKPEPAQLSLFDALTELDQNLDTLKKSVARAEVEIDKAFKKRA